MSTPPDALYPDDAGGNIENPIAPVVIHANLFISRWYLRPEMHAEFLKRFNALWQADITGLRAVANFVFYGFGRDINEFVAVESWKREADIAAVRKTEPFQVAVASLMECCTRPMEMQLYTGLDAPRDWLFDAYPAGPSTVHPNAHGIGAKFL